MRQIFVIALAGLMATSLLTAQTARKQDVVDVYHGVSVADPYRWLEDDRAPEVEAWVAEQQRQTEAYFAGIPFHAPALKRMQQLFDYEKISSPQRVGNALFYFRNSGSQNHSVFMRAVDGKEPEAILDPNTWTKDGTEAIADYDISPDGHWLAFAKSKAGSDWREIHVMDLRTLRQMPDVLQWVKVSNLSFHNDGFYYSRYPSPEKGTSELSSVNAGHTACYHKIGTKQDDDAVLFADPATPDQFNFCYVPEGADFIVRSARKGADRGSREWVRRLDKPNDPWHPIWTSTEKDLSILGIDGTTILAHTDLDAPNGKVVRIENLWGEPRLESVIPTSGIPMAGVSMVGGYVFVTRTIDVKHTVEVYDYAGKHVRNVDLPGAGTVGGLDGKPTDKVLYYTFNSFTQPTTIFSYDVQKGSSSIWRAARVQFDPSQFEVKQVFATSKDGTRIPMYLVHKKGLVYDGTAPTLMYGYGGFNIPNNAGFSPLLIAWLEQGCVYASANLRGGNEYGEEWHDAGTKLRKQNVFDDAIACAEWLVANKVTSKSKLAVHGRSNGGLLVGALMTQRPDLFRAVVPEVGVMDMLRYHLFTIGWNWASDYGTVADEAEFKALYAYSPYHQLKAGVQYPSCLTMTADHDDRVVPAHSFKFFARLKEVYKGNNPMLLRVETKSGHGAVNTTALIKGVCDKYVFLWKELGATPKF